jgi:hypothetical protein
MPKTLLDAVNEAMADMRAEASPELIATLVNAIRDTKATGKHDALRSDERIVRAVLDVFNCDAPTEAILAARKVARR